MNKKFIRILFFGLIDYLAIYVLIGSAYIIRSLLADLTTFIPPLDTKWSYIISHLWWMGAIFIGFAIYEGLYTKRRIFWEEARLIARSVTLWALVITAVLALSREIDIFSRIILVLIWIVGLIFLPLAHYWGKKLLIRLGFYHAPMLIIGAGTAARNTAEGILSQPYLGYDLIGFLDDDPKKQEEKIEFQAMTLPVLGSIEKMEEVILRHRIRTVVVAIPSLSSERLAHITNTAHHLVKRIMIIPNIKGVSLTNTELHYLFDQQLFMLKLSNNLASSLNMWIKRLFDTTVSLLMMPFILPLIAILGLLIKLESPGPIFFAHVRIGQSGRKIPTLKFRSMYRDSQERLSYILKTDPIAKEEWETNFKLKDDPRITRIGSFLRKTSLDELPQIFNVMMGQMSLVGPRPVIQEELDKYYGEYAEYYHMVPPGITGLWQVSGRSNTSYDYRVGIDTWYVLNWSLWLDVIILFKTVKVVLKREGAY